MVKNVNCGSIHLQSDWIHLSYKLIESGPIWLIFKEKLIFFQPNQIKLALVSESILRFLVHISFLTSSNIKNLH